jgi:hypothetical protein
MTETFQDEQKESTAATKIEHALRLAAMKFQILDSLPINAQPMVDIGVLGAGVPLLNLAQTILINAGKHRPKR